MKKVLQIIVLLSFLPAIWSCKKDEKRVIFTGGTAPVASASLADSIPLSFATKDNQAFQLSWTNPNYQFNTGVSSLNVNYNVEIDTTGSNFTSSKRQVISLGTDLSKTFTQSEFNDYLLNQLQLVPAVPHDIQVRVTAFLVGGAEPEVSNVLGFKVIPFVIPPKVAPPTTGRLFLVGDATDGGWSNPVPTPDQEFLKIDDLHFQITVSLVGGKQYLFIPLNGDWGHKFACKKTADQSASGGDFGLDLSDNFPGPAIGGDYKIEVDFQRGKYTVTKL